MEEVVPPLLRHLFHTSSVDGRGHGRGRSALTTAPLPHLFRRWKRSWKRSFRPYYGTSSIPLPSMEEVMEEVVPPLLRHLFHTSSVDGRGHGRGRSALTTAPLP